MDKKSDRIKGYLKKMGIAGFLFFLIKGLVWIFIFLGGAKLLWGE